MMPSEQSRSQHGEDVYVLSLIDPGAAKVVVDVGANDGFSWSNSYLFGLRGYRLVLIEPMPRFADACRTLWHGRDDVAVEACAVGLDEGTAQFHINNDTAHDLLAMRSSLDKAFVPGQDVSTIEVPIHRLDTLLKRHRVPSSFAFLTVDAEGFDHQVLESLDFDRWRPSVICVEDECIRAEVSSLLSARGYDLHAILGSNGIYLPTTTHLVLQELAYQQARPE